MNTKRYFSTVSWTLRIKKDSIIWTFKAKKQTIYKQENRLASNFHIMSDVTEAISTQFWGKGSVTQVEFNVNRKIFWSRQGETLLNGWWASNLSNYGSKIATLEITIIELNINVINCNNVNILMEMTGGKRRQYWKQYQWANFLVTIT